MFGEFFSHKRNQTTIPCQINQMIQSLHGYARVMFWRIMEYHGIPIPKHLNTLGPKHRDNNNRKTPFKSTQTVLSYHPNLFLFRPKSLAKERQALAAWNVNKIGRIARPRFSPPFFTKRKILKFLPSLGTFEIRSIWASAIHRCSGSSLISEEFAWTNMKWTSYQHLLGILIVFFCFPSQYKSQNKESWVD